MSRLSPNTFCKKQKKTPKISFKGLPEAGEKQCMEKKERKSKRKKEEQKSVLKMASYA